MISSSSIEIPLLIRLEKPCCWSRRMSLPPCPSSTQALCKLPASWVAVVAELADPRVSDQLIWAHSEFHKQLHAMDIILSPRFIKQLLSSAWMTLLFRACGVHTLISWNFLTSIIVHWKSVRLCYCQLRFCHHANYLMLSGHEDHRENIMKWEYWMLAPSLTQSSCH